MSEHLSVTSEQFFQIRDRYIRTWGKPLGGPQLFFVKMHIQKYHPGTEGEEQLAQIASHQAALMSGQIKLNDLLPKPTP